MKKSHFAEALQSCLKRDAWYVGASAGSVLVCPYIDYIRQMDDPSKAQLDNYLGLELIDFLIMPHINHPKFAAQAAKIVEDMKNQSQIIIGLRDDQALVVQNNYIKIY